MSRKNINVGKESGFTLIEIAIVVVIIGLLLGGVLKGQEMIKSARSHNLVSQSNALKAAILGFSDRYRSLPGDYARAGTNIPNITANVVDGTGAITTQGQEGNGDSLIGGLPGDVTTAPETAVRTGVDFEELVLVWLHLGNSGYISGGYTGSNTNVVEATWVCPDCMTNAYSGQMFIINDNEQTGPNADANDAIYNQIWSGARIPVEVISDIDKKTDDGDPGNGNFRVSDLHLGACSLNDASPAVAATYANNDATNWSVLSGATCGGVYMF